MIDFLGSLICRFRPHKWRRKKLAALKACARCGAVQPVKARKAKAEG